MTNKINSQKTLIATRDQISSLPPDRTIQLTDLIEGAIDCDRKSGVRGWIWDRSNPYQPLTVELIANREVIARSVADIFDMELVEQKIGNGKHAFVLKAESWPELPLPIELVVRIAGTDLLLGKFLIESQTDIEGLATSAPKGHVDGIVSGEIRGWALDRANPDVPVTVDILDNGTLLETIACTEYRQDLRSAGYGTGNCGFSFALPISMLDGHTHSLSICYSGTQRPLANGTFIYGLTRESELTKYIANLVTTVNHLKAELVAAEQRLLARHEALLTIQRESMERELKVLRKLLVADTEKGSASPEVTCSVAGPDKLASKKKGERTKRSLTY